MTVIPDSVVKIGEDVTANIYHLDLDDLIPYVDPSDYDLTNVPTIKPSDYFITSGEAVDKANIMAKEIWELAGNLRKEAYNKIMEWKKCKYQEAMKLYKENKFQGPRGKEIKNFIEYEKAMWKCAGSAKKLVNNLIKARGQNHFLETEWQNHNLYVIPKNPRGI